MTRPDLELADRIIELMNDALKRDAMAVTELICNRVLCNSDLAEHPTIQVGRGPGLKGDPEVCVVGMLGFLNGLCGVWEYDGDDSESHLDGLGPITCGELVRNDPEQPIVIGAFVRTDILRAKK